VDLRVQQLFSFQQQEQYSLDPSHQLWLNLYSLPQMHIELRRDFHLGQRLLLLYRMLAFFTLYLNVYIFKFINQVINLYIPHSHIKNMKINKCFK
jgi:hypothetical protein